ncbi:MAG: hypothetical protein JKY56_06260 [Kofleriaceae bacterium]|nr:hypothetical protein [Kofleriaceae bacterium]
MVTKLTLAIATLAMMWAAMWTASGDASAEGRPKYGSSITGTLLEEPLSLDPVSVRTHSDLVLVSMVFDTLYRIKGDVVVPHLASALPDESDPLHVRISLRPGVLFSNGRKLKADDVVRSLERLRRSNRYFYMGAVVSIESVVADTGVEEIVFTLRRADPRLSIRLSDVHTSVSAQGRVPTWRRAIGTGPFHVVERSSARREVRLKASEKHFAGRTYLDELKLRWHDDKSSEARQYESGSAQLSSRGSIAFAGHQPKYRTKNIQSRARILTYLGFGKAQPLDQEAEFRAIVSAAIGRAGMMKMGSGEEIVPSTSPVPTETQRRRVSRKAGLTPDLQRVTTLMKSLIPRYPALKLGSLSLELIVNSSRPDDAAIGAKVAAALFAFGIRTRIVSLSASAFARRLRTGAYDIYVGQLVDSSVFASDTLRAAFAVSGQRVVANSLASLKTRFERDYPIVPLFHRSLRVHYRGDLQGVRFAPHFGAVGGTWLGFDDIHLIGEPEKN